MSVENCPHVVGIDDITEIDTVKYVVTTCENCGMVIRSEMAVKP